MAKEKIEKTQSLEKTLWAAADKLIGAVMPHDYLTSSKSSKLIWV